MREKKKKIFPTGGVDLWRNLNAISHVAIDGTKRVGFDVCGMTGKMSSISSRALSPLEFALLVLAIVLGDF